MLQFLWAGLKYKALREKGGYFSPFQLGFANHAYEKKGKQMNTKAKVRALICGV